MSRPRLPHLPALVALAWAASGCAPPSDAAPSGSRRPRVARPEGCRAVAAGTPLQPLVDAAAAGQALCLAPGRHAGPVVVRAAVTLWGPPEAVIVAAAGHTAVTLGAPGARLLGLTVDGVGGGSGPLEVAVRGVADHVVIEGVTVLGAAHGIVVERARGVRVVGNHVRGTTEAAVGQRGDTIRLWETDDAVVEGNLVEDGRDLVVWYSRGAAVRGNRVLRARYGTHFMYSHDTEVTGNEYVDITVGIFVMYSKRVVIAGNVIANAAGAAGIAIGLKDSGTVRIADNTLVGDELGIYLDATPQQRDETVAITGNRLHLCRTALAFHAATHGVTVRGNDFGGNDAQVRVDGGGDALLVTWDGNWFDDYAGYDLDHDGIGDVPYQLRSFSGELVGRRPDLAFFSGTPALALADAAAHLDPLFQPKTLLEDPRPRMSPVASSTGAP